MQMQKMCMEKKYNADSKNGTENLQRHNKKCNIDLMLKILKCIHLTALLKVYLIKAKARLI